MRWVIEGDLEGKFQRCFWACLGQKRGDVCLAGAWGDPR